MTQKYRNSRLLSLTTYLYIFVGVFFGFFGMYKSKGGSPIDKAFLIISLLFFLRLIFATAFFKTYRKTILNGVVLIIFLLCTINFLRGIVQGLQEGRIQNAFNPIFALCMIVPFSLLISYNRDFSYSTLFSVLLKCTKVGILLTPLTFLTQYAYFFPYGFLSASFFLLGFFPLANRRQRTWILIGLLCYLFIGFYADIRSVVLRVALLGALTLFYSKGQFLLSKGTVRRIIVIAAIAIPILGFIYYQLIVGNSWGFVSSEDTRSFLYIEIISSLERSGQLWTGKGTLGTYFSDWFYKQMGVDSVVDTFNRINVEVGVLAYLLKGGIILVFFLLFLQLTVGIKALRFSKVYALSGLIILTHIIVSFVENIPMFNLYEITIWVIIGLLLKGNRERVLNARKERHLISK